MPEKSHPTLGDEDALLSKKTPGTEPHSVEDVISDVEQALGEFVDQAKHAVDEVNKKAGRDIFLAVLFAFLLLGIAAACLLWFPWGFVGLAVLLIGGGQVEMGQVLARVRGVRISYVPLITGSVLFTVAAYAYRVYPELVGSVVLWAVAGLMVITILVVRLFGEMDGYVRDVSHTIFMFGYPCLLAVSLIFMLAEVNGPALVATFVLTVAATDTGGYFLGIWKGKHAIAPKISPKKSWEGLVGSFLLAFASGVVMTVFLLGDAWWKGIVLAVVIVIVGFLGDLVESQIKRDLGVKDMGTLIPGHGGIMDRMDSYILAAFPAWLVMMWLFPVG
ncbi:MAG: phosphatidate cytidylyltransferase [Propionibacteriaceae bacterium]|jgi:phosphatidate cytidylyltransferase|nr:phosphatidate cytidylyltransferase [Propionibacteriaceae bacterium]